MRFTIIGAGNGGLAFAAFLSKQGYNVNLFDKFTEIIEPIQTNNNKIEFNEDKENYSVQLDVITDNLNESIQYADFIFVVTPAFIHETLAYELASIIKKKQIVILHPGRTGGAIIFKNIFNKFNKNNIIGETETLLFSCRKINGTKVKVYGKKNYVGLATIPSDKSVEVTSSLNQAIPYFKPFENILETSLNNMGAVFHPAPLIFNINRIENKEEFKFYLDGITPLISTYIEKIDQERIKVAKAYNLEVPNALEWLNTKYGVKSSNLYDSLQKNKSYSSITAPSTVMTRYVLEDVPMSLVPISHLAKEKKIEVPIINSLIKFASDIYNKDFYNEGRNLKDLSMYID
ncbi:NAD/NADP-dependent octopine/nopaline dehydrogenase family protein [Salinicoccus bachuensis]|uniref:6-phosphogluconate dehydrogenase, decarboxylating n=1 Tax=Salinicoccus bachuensis TaxID=3136731 RepID=A0ABZ3CKT3_9STAP